MLLVTTACGQQEGENNNYTSIIYRKWDFGCLHLTSLIKSRSEMMLLEHSSLTFCLVFQNYAFDFFFQL